MLFNAKTNSKIVMDHNARMMVIQFAVQIAVDANAVRSFPLLGLQASACFHEIACAMLLSVGVTEEEMKEATHNPKIGAGLMESIKKHGEEFFTANPEIVTKKDD